MLAKYMVANLKIHKRVHESARAFFMKLCDLRSMYLNGRQLGFLRFACISVSTNSSNVYTLHAMHNVSFPFVTWRYPKQSWQVNFEF